MKKSEFFALMAMILCSPRMNDGWVFFLAVIATALIFINLWLESRE